MLLLVDENISRSGKNSFAKTLGASFDQIHGNTNQGELKRYVKSLLLFANFCKYIYILELVFIEGTLREREKE